MPIKFACQHCKNVITVDSKFAGRQGKCNQCGGVVTAPAHTAGPVGQTPIANPKAAAKPATTATQHPSGAAVAAKPTGAVGTGAPNAAPAPSVGKLAVGGSLAHVLDELTESDYKRHSPFQAVYSPPKPKVENSELLQRAADQEAKEKDSNSKKKKGDSDGLPSKVKSLATADILVGLSNYGLSMAIVFVGVGGLGKAASRIPYLGAGPAAGIMVGGFLATVFMAAGMGLLSKQLWGYLTALGIHAFNAGFITMMVVANLADPSALGWRVGPVLAAYAMIMPLFSKQCRQFFGLPAGSKNYLWISAGCWLLGIILGSLLALTTGVFTALYIELQ